MGKFGNHGVVGVEDGRHLFGESGGWPKRGKWPEPSDCRCKPAERPWTDHPAHGLVCPLSNSPDVCGIGPVLEEFRSPREIATSRTGKRERTNTLWILDRNDLGDCSTHRCAHDVCSANAVVVEHGNGVICHVLEREFGVGNGTATGTTIIEGNRAKLGCHCEAL